MEKIEIGYGTHGQHVMTARNALNEGVLIVECNDVAFTQTLHTLIIQREFCQWLNAQVKREIEVHLFERFTPVARRDLA